MTSLLTETGLLESMAETLGGLLKDAGLQMATAESCTGGWIAQTVTSVAGSSEWFDRGFVTYSNEAKREMLGVRAQTLRKHGAVSERVVLDMALAAVRKSQASVAVSVSGIAGPGGGSDDKPVGTVWFAWAFEDQAEASMMCFPGDRHQVRYGAVMVALQGLIARIPSGLKNNDNAPVDVGDP